MTGSVIRRMTKKGARLVTERVANLVTKMAIRRMVEEPPDSSARRRPTFTATAAVSQSSPLPEDGEADALLSSLGKYTEFVVTYMSPSVTSLVVSKPESLWDLWVPLVG